jgi:hypothetical protein
VLDLLLHVGMENCNPTSTPLVPSERLARDTGALPGTEVPKCRWQLIIFDHHTLGYFLCSEQSVSVSLPAYGGTLVKEHFPNKCILVFVNNIW